MSEHSSKAKKKNKKTDFPVMGLECLVLRLLQRKMYKSLHFYILCYKNASTLVEFSVRLTICFRFLLFWLEPSQIPSFSSRPFFQKEWLCCLPWMWIQDFPQGFYPLIRFSGFLEVNP